MKSAGKARNNGLYRHIRTSKEIIRNLLNDSHNCCFFHNYVKKGCFAAAPSMQLALNESVYTRSAHLI